MSEERLATYIDDHIALGDAAREPVDPEARELAGTVKLARGVLTAPEPSGEVTRRSREKLMTHIADDAATRDPQPNPVATLRRWIDALRRH
jgi:hypothetical protein